MSSSWSRWRCPRVVLIFSYFSQSSWGFLTTPRRKTATAIRGRPNPHQAAKTCIVFHLFNLLHYNPTYHPSALLITYSLPTVQLIQPSINPTDLNYCIKLSLNWSLSYYQCLSHLLTYYFIIVILLKPLLCYDISPILIYCCITVFRISYMVFFVGMSYLFACVDWEINIFNSIQLPGVQGVDPKFLG